MMKAMAGLAALAALCGCSQAARFAAGPTTIPDAADWREIATPADRARLRGWRDAWMSALPAATAAEASKVRAQGALFNPDLALAGSMPPPGDYHCRVFKLGAKQTGLLDYVEYPYFDCRIDDEGDVRSFYKQTGSQRPVGLLFADGDARAIFLGTLLLGDERAPLQYGQDAQRDMIGYVQRVGGERWRLVLPSPAFESQLDVIELVPA